MKFLWFVVNFLLLYTPTAFGNALDDMRIASLIDPTNVHSSKIIDPKFLSMLGAHAGNIETPRQSTKIHDESTKVILKEKDHEEGPSEAHVPSGKEVSQGIHVSPHPNDREGSDLKGTAAKQGKDEEKSAEEDSHEPKASNIHEETMGPHEPENERTSSGDYSASSNLGGQRENEEPNVSRNRFNQAQPPSEPEVMTERATTEESNLTGNRYGQDRDLIESDGSSKNGPEESSLHGNKYSQTIEHAKPVSRIPPSGNVSQVASTKQPTTTPAATHPTANASMTTIAKDGPTSVQ